MRKECNNPFVFWILILIIKKLIILLLIVDRIVTLLEKFILFSLLLYQYYLDGKGSAIGLVYNFNFVCELKVNPIILNIIS